MHTKDVLCFYCDKPKSLRDYQKAYVQRALIITTVQDDTLPTLLPHLYNYEVFRNYLF